MSLRFPAQRRLLIATATVIAVHAVAIVNQRLTHAGDFDISLELGRRFLAGEHLYAGGLHYPYMPAAAMVFAPLALLPPWLGFTLRYAAALGCLWLTLQWLARMARPRDTVARAHDAGVMGLTLLLASHYIVRDLDDGGPHLLLLAAVVGGLWCVGRDRLGFGAAAFGFAIAVKAPYGLLILFLAWQRQWRLTLLTAAAATVWIVLPSVWMGPSPWWHHQMEWTTTVAASVRGTPLPGPRDSEERVQNQALAPAVVRLAQRLGAPEHARWLGAAASAAVLTWLMWTTRRPQPIVSPAWLREASAVLVATALLSPVAWIQHLVVVVPGLMVILTAARAASSLAVLRGGALALYAFLALALNREVLGRVLYLDLLTYGLHTVALLVLLAVLLIRRPRVESEIASRAPRAAHGHE